MKMSKYLLGAVIAVFGIFGSVVTPAIAAQPSTLHTADPLQVLPELTDSNASKLLLQQKGHSLVISYSPKEASPQQQAQLEMLARESHDYAGIVSFYLLNVDKYPATWTALTKGETWTHGLNFRMVNSVVSPAEIAVVSDTVNGKQVQKTSLTKLEMRDHINFYLKDAPLVWHLTDANSLYTVNVPSVIMVYRSSSPQTLMLPMQFQNFAYQSQLYPNRLAFFLLDLDQYDASKGMGMDLPKQDDGYYVLFVPGQKLGDGRGTIIHDQLLSRKDLEYKIYSYFGPEFGPVKLSAPILSAPATP